MEITNDIINIFNSCDAFGILTGVAISLQLAMKILKFKHINSLFIKYKIKWIKPYIVMILGGLSGGIASCLSETEIPNGITVGVIAGITSVGWNEIVNKSNSSKRTK